MSRDASRPAENFNVENIAFEKVPNQSALFLKFLENSPEIREFYPSKSVGLDDFALRVLRDHKVSRRELCDALGEINQSVNAGEKAFENINKLSESDCFAVVTGQQAGLFSGALYTIYKAISAIKLARELEEQNIKAVPVFWIAEEDHDFDEVRETRILDENTQLKAFENSPEKYRDDEAVGLIEFDESIRKTIEALFDALPLTEFTEKIKSLVSESYRSGETFSTAFAKFLAEIFKDHGLIFVLPLNEKLKRMLAPFFAETIDRSVEVVSRLLGRSEELTKRGFHSQVLVEKDSFPFFYQDADGIRHALRQNPKTGEISSKNGKLNFHLEGLVEIARTAPEKLSPNALLRPLAQDYLFPTITYLGGAAEIAYFAQNSAVYELLERPVTPIRHRASLTVVEARNRRTLDKYEHHFTDLFSGKDAVKAAIVERFLSRETSRVFAGVEDAINLELKELEAALTKSEPTLAANAARRRQKIMWHIAALRKKFHKAEILNHETINRRLDDLFESLLPAETLQERSVNVITFLNLHGLYFIEWIYRASRLEGEDHQLLIL